MAWFKKKSAAPPQTTVQDSVFGATGMPGGRSVRHALPRRWSIAGALIGLLGALVLFAPASWLARSLASATNGHLLIVDTRGSIWNGSGMVVLTGGSGSRDAASLPGRLHWRMRMNWTGGLQLAAQQDCCINGELLMGIKPGLGRMAVSVDNRADWLVRLPAGLLSGLGTPWNTLQPSGSLRLSANELRLESVQGRWRQFGDLHLDLQNLSSRVSTVAPLGSYRFSIQADPGNPGVSTMRLSTLEGALQLTGVGTLSPGGKSRFTGEAAAAPGREEALNNLLNIIGRRQGARSVLTIG